MMKKIIIIWIVTFASVVSAYGQTEAVDDTTKTDDQKTAYEKLYADTDNLIEAEGLIDLKLVDGKVYFEFPKNLLGKDMIIGTSVEETSNRNDAASLERPNQPLLIKFTQRDSTIYLHKGAYLARADSENGNISNAIDKNSISPILHSFKIDAETPDSSAFVFDASKIFMSGKEELSPFGPYSGVSSMFSNQSSSFKAGLSLLLDVEAYQSNVTVTSYLSYGISTTFLGFQVENDRPATYKVKHSIMLLPEEKMKPRIADDRIGIYSNEYLVFSETENGVKTENFAHRWRLKLSDSDEYDWSGSTDVLEPITFYVDTKFPEKFTPYIIQGINAWNEAFEEIGFNNVINVRLFPEDDENFSPNNTSYSTVNFVLSSRSSTVGQRWTDPRTGEILSSSVNIYGGMIDKIKEDLFVRTSAANPEARTLEPSDELIGQTLKNYTTHLIGNSLGLTKNLGASSAIPVDSLRSPSFTQEYGITPSIMDEAFYNIVAQPGDYQRGVQMTPKDLGVYDFYAIDWLYRPYPEFESYREEVATLKEKIEEKQDDPMYRYRSRHVNNIFDPDIAANDLGDNQVKATEYALNNLEYTFLNLNDWLADEDPDHSLRTELHFSFINIHFFWYLRQPLNNLGGVRQYQTYEEAPYPSYEVVSAEEQKETINYLLTLLENLEWMNDKNVTYNIDSLSGNSGEYMRSVLFTYIMDWGVRRTEFTQTKVRNNPYTQEKFLNDVYNYLWDDFDPNSSNEARLSMQSLFTKYLMLNSPINDNNPSAGIASTAFNLTNYALRTVSLGNSSKVNRMVQQIPLNAENIELIQKNTDEVALLSDRAVNSQSNSYFELNVYELLNKTVNRLEDLQGQTENEKFNNEYDYLLFKVNQTLGSD
jgi:hypothetical protein